MKPHVAPGSASSARVKVLVSFVAGTAATVTTILWGSPRAAPLVGWDVLAAVYAAWVWWTVWPMDAAATAVHAQREDPGRELTDLVLLGAAISSLVAVGVVLFGASSAPGNVKYVRAGFAVGSVIVSWVLLHTVFALRYAKLYYGSPSGGIDFNQSADPQYSDFAYLAFTLGMTFQVSDTDIGRADIRRTALRHALVSFPFGTVVIATSINLVSGLAK
ncbi:MAG TPA: DUF1345 domain-containing protein [Sporichthyaceae bacterium]|nr:DUF1345 domain-containing protein [Sporichthyaceae bacterium]